MGKFSVSAQIPTSQSNAIKGAFAAINKSMKPVYRKAVGKACKPIVNKARQKLVGAKAKKDDAGKVGMTGQMKKAMGQKVKTYPSGTVVGIVGPRTGFKIAVRTPIGSKIKVGDLERKIKTTTTKEERSAVTWHDPAKVAHLVEFGHGGPHPAPPHPFLRPAFDESKPEVANILQAEVASGLEKTALKAASKIGGA